MRNGSIETYPIGDLEYNQALIPVYAKDPPCQHIFQLNHY